MNESVRLRLASWFLTFVSATPSRSFGMSRDDSGSFLGAYTKNEIVKKNPFASIDQTGVGQLV